MAVTSNATEVVKPYEYQQLLTPNTIRIFCLEPADSQKDLVKGSLKHFDRYEEYARLEHRQKYTAVSYTWGSADFSECLILSDPTSGENSYLSITHSVKIMLQHFRKRHKRIYLWIDAICLNQGDAAEKAHQIPLMGEIYQQAHKSYFWLGVEEGFEAARVFAYFRLLAVTEFEEYTTEKLRGGEHLDEDLDSQVHDFLHRAWFFRRWILQEAGLSRHGVMWCGDHTLQYDLFVFACRKLSSKSKDVSTTTRENPHRHSFAIETTVQIHDLLHASQTHQNLTALLWKFHKSACSEEKDRIGALYGLFTPSLRPKIDLAGSYTRIYQAFAVELAKTSSERLMLHLAHFQPLYLTKGVQAPSWIPDWSRERVEPPLSMHVGLQAGMANSVRDGYYKKLQDSKPPGTDYRQEQWTWRPFLRRNQHILLQCVRMSTYFDEDENDQNDQSGSKCDKNGRKAVLRIQWFHPLASKHGMPICSIVSVETLPRDSHIPTAFLEELREIAKKLRASGGLMRFCAFLAGTIFADGGKHDVEDVVSCFTALATSDTPTSDTQDLPCGSIILSLAIFLSTNALSLIQWRTPSHAHLYALGPASLRRGDYLIPLATLVGHKNPKGVFASKEGEGWVENMVGVRVCGGDVEDGGQTGDKGQGEKDNGDGDGDGSADRPQEKQEQKHASEEKNEIPLRPVRAKYLGFCTSYLPSRFWDLPVKDDNGIGLTREQRVALFVRHLVREEARADAEAGGSGIPGGVVDIV